jgi:hypothetical protein
MNWIEKLTKIIMKDLDQSYGKLWELFFHVFF